MKTSIISLLVSFSIVIMSHSINAQSVQLKKETTPDEIEYIQRVFEKISASDQEYRSLISAGTLDTELVAAIDSVFNHVGIEEGMAYKKALNLKLPESVKDSLWQLQHALDFENHIFLRGIFETYGFIPEEIIKEKNFVQILLLMHPPKDWDIPSYHKSYADLLLPEVHAGRMPAKTYALFYDNILAKILREPQLYGTNEQMDMKTMKALPPVIENLLKTNKARTAIGLPILKEGEYRLASTI